MKRPKNMKFHPKYTFRVNPIDPVALASQTLPNSYENIILGLKSIELIIPYWKKPLKYGDTFTLYGVKAIQCYETYIGKQPKVLEIVPESSDSGNGTNILQNP